MGGGDLNAVESLKSARANGIILTVTDGKLIIRGVGASAVGLLESIRASKSEIISIIQAESANEARKAKQASSNPLMPGPTEFPVPDVMPRFSLDQQRYMIDQVMCHGIQAIGWCMVRGNAYFENHPESTFEEQDAAAAWDFLGVTGRRGE